MLKARVNPIDLMTTRQKRALREKVNEIAEDTVQKKETRSVRRWMKLLLLALNQEFGFGAARLNRMLSAINRITEEERKDPVFWTHADMRLKQLGLDFPEESEG